MLKEVKTQENGIIKLFFQGEVQWASVQTPKENFAGTGTEYSIDVEATEQDVEKLLALGLNKGLKQTGKPKQLARTASGKTVLNFIRPTLKRNGQPTQPVTVVDENGNPTDSLVGNGSEALVQVTLFPYDNKFGQGMSARLDGLQILKLVPYKSESTSLLDKDAFSSKKLSNNDSTKQKTTKTSHKKNEDLI